MAEEKPVEEMTADELFSTYMLIKDDSSKFSKIKKIERMAKKSFGRDFFQEAKVGYVPPSEKSGISEILPSIASGATNAVTGIIDTPRAILNVGANLAEKGYEFATGDKLYGEKTRQAIDTVTGPRDGTASQFMEGKSAFENFLVPPTARQIAADIPLVKDAQSFNPETNLGQAVERTTEFVPFAGKNIFTMGVFPALTSLYAGKIKGVEGTNLQIPAEIVTAIVTPIIAKRLISPKGGQIDGTTKQQLEYMADEGVVPTAGLLTNDDKIKAWEEATYAGKSMQEASFEAFSRAVLKRIGIDANRATPEALQAVQNKFRSDYAKVTDALENVKIIPDKNITKQMNEIFEELSGSQSAILEAPVFKRIRDQFEAAAKSGQPVPPAQLQFAHRTLGKLATKGDINGDYAREFLPLINKTMHKHSSKEMQDLLIDTNRRYRDWLAIKDTLRKSGDAVDGLVTPQALRTSTSKIFKDDYLFGKSELSNLAKAGSSVLKPLPNSGTSAREGSRGLFGGNDADALGGATMGAALSATDPIMGAAIGAAGSRLISPMRNEAITSPMMQSYMKNQMIPELEKNNLLRMLSATTMPY